MHKNEHCVAVAHWVTRLAQLGGRCSYVCSVIIHFIYFCIPHWKEGTRFTASELANIQNVLPMFCTQVHVNLRGCVNTKKGARVWKASILDKSKANWKHMCCTVQQFSVVGGWGLVGYYCEWGCYWWEKETEEWRGKKVMFVGDMGGQRLGGHENVNLDVSEAIYSSLGRESQETCVLWVDSI